MRTWWPKGAGGRGDISGETGKRGLTTTSIQCERGVVCSGPHMCNTKLFAGLYAAPRDLGLCIRSWPLIKCKGGDDSARRYMPCFAVNGRFLSVNART